MFHKVLGFHPKTLIDDLLTYNAKIIFFRFYRELNQGPVWGLSLDRYVNKWETALTNINN